ncbi:snf2 family helicase [Niveomyces insectorum RCEF 264]|uniref:Snf2 family helicase n=1 Tax=Niveomyces insectorum RCEF 264 TaxID=1081102 RepID=A0A167TVW0_9HYPO|nr:snf2 family helicase [Niveomyces insectorum RCEF 264]
MRTRPDSGTTARDSKMSRNPFSIARAASFARSNSMDGKTSTQAGKSQMTQAKTAKTQRGRPTENDDIEDSNENDDSDSDSDELAGSPYFTQPTQVVTQPTQLLTKPLTTLPSLPGNKPRYDRANDENDSHAFEAETIAIPSSSSPLQRSIVEVPASSPFQSPRVPPPPSVPARGRLGSLMAPAGTVFRSPIPAPKPSSLPPPPRHANTQASGKPGAAKNSNNDEDKDDDGDSLDDFVRVDDSSDDDDGDGRTRAPARGDIRPASFRQPPFASSSTAGKKPGPSETAAAANNNHKSLNDRKIAHLVVKMQSQLRSKGYDDANSAACRAALLARHYNIHDAVNDMLDKRLVQSSSPPLSSPPQSKVPNMIRAFAYQGIGGPQKPASATTTTDPSRATSRASSPGTASSATKRRALSPSPRPKRRRLVQGRKYRTHSSPVQTTPVREKSRLVDLTATSDMDGDEREEQEAERSSPPVIISDDDAAEDEGYSDDDDDGSAGDNDNDIDGATFDVEKRVLKYFNTCTVDDLVAMLGAKARSKAQTILSHRPFHSRASVTRVRNNSGGGSGGARGKKASANIGEDIFDAVEDYVVALQAIDVVVAQCEQKGLRIRSTLHRWNVDVRGCNKTTTATTTTHGNGLLTPSSEVSNAGGSSGKDETDTSGYVPLPIPQEPKLMRGHCTMKNYQLYGLNWLWELYQRNFGCILADDMGLGKTCQVISFLSHLIESYQDEHGDDGDDGDSSNGESDEEQDDDGTRPWPNLVVVPPSTLANWKAEFKKFAPKIRVTTYSGTAAERDEIYVGISENRRKHHVVLTSYSQIAAKQDADAMRKLAPNVAIFDEGHKMKNSQTALYKSLKRINANWRLILTGTPVQNNLMEMINLLNFIQPTLFERHLSKLDALFRQQFSLQDVSNGALLFSDRVRRARIILEPFILRRRKEEVLFSMPRKTVRVVYCDLDPTQRPIYESYERQFKKGKAKTTTTTAATDDNAKSSRSAAAANARSAVTGLSNDQNNVWIQLRKSAIHAQLFRRYYDDKTVTKMAKVLMAEVPQAELRQPHLQHLVNELKDCSDFELHTWCRDYRCLRAFDMPDGLFLQSGKVRALLDLVRSFQANGDRALVFTRFARVLNILRECLAHAGLDYVSLEGATRVEERQAIIDEFNSNDAIPVFLLTTGSGGSGINLTAANKVVIFDQSDNPQDDVQAENRAHRLGQTRDVEVVKLLTRGTIEELVYKACQTKLELAQRVTAGSGGSSGEATAAAAAAAADADAALLDGEKMAQAVEAEVREMLLAQNGATPPAG